MNFKNILTSLFLIICSTAWTQDYHYSLTASTYDGNNDGIKVMLVPSAGGDTLTQFTTSSSTKVSFAAFTGEPVNITVSKQGYLPYTLQNQSLSCLAHMGGVDCDFTDQLTHVITLYPDTFIPLFDSVPNNRLLSHKTYVVLNEVDIQDKLIIEPGVTLIFGSRGIITSEKKIHLIANGTATDSIKIYGRRGYNPPKVSELAGTTCFNLSSPDGMNLDFSYTILNTVHFIAENTSVNPITSSNFQIKNSTINKSHFQLSNLTTSFLSNKVHDYLNFKPDNNFIYQTNSFRNITFSNNYFYNIGHINLESRSQSTLPYLLEINDNYFENTDITELTANFSVALFNNNTIKSKSTTLNLSSNTIEFNCNYIETKLRLGLERLDDGLDNEHTNLDFIMSNNYFNLTSGATIEAYPGNYFNSKPEVINNYFDLNNSHLNFRLLADAPKASIQQNTFRNGVLILTTNLNTIGNIFDTELAYVSEDNVFRSNIITQDLSCANCFIPTINHSNYKEDANANRQVSHDLFLVDSLPYIKESSPLDFSFDNTFKVGYQVLNSCSSHKFVEPLDVHSISGNLLGVDSAIVMAINTSDSTEYLTHVVNEIYNFDRLTSGNYILHAIPYPNQINTYTSTVFANKLDIHSADKMELKNDIINANFSMLTPISTDGEHEITGTVRYRDSQKADTTSIYNQKWFSSETWKKKNINFSTNALHLPLLLINQDGQVVASSLTDEKGEYTFSSIPDGSYTIISQRYGYQLSYEDNVVLDHEYLIIHAFLEEARGNITANQGLGHENVIRLFPNPMDNYLTIDLGDKSSQVIEISDIYGEKIKTITTDNQHVRIDTSEWLSGIYFVRIDDKRFKLIK